MKRKPNLSLTNALALACVLLLAACGRTPPAGVKIGDPYSVNGTTYYPEYDPTYDEIGEGSWYGPGFHGKKAASGETFNENDLTAAHPTLPMPSLVRVTNLQNGKSVVVRINDRGPFKSRRIIDLSKKSAERIGMHSTMKVRVQYLAKETEEYLATLRATGKAPNMFAYNDRIDKGLNQPQPSPKVVVAKAEPVEQQEEEVPVESVKAPVDESTAQAAPAEDVKVTDMMPPEKAPEKSSAKEVKLVGMDEQPTRPFSPPPVKGVAAKQQAMPEKKHTEVPPLFAAATPSPAPVAGSEGGYYVQVGSFSSHENAQKRAESLAGVAAVATDKVTRADKEWWRVRLGPFGDRQSAGSVLGKVRDLVPDAHITH